MSQGGFSFDVPLAADPAPLIAPKAPRPENEVFEEQLRGVLDDIADDVDIDAPLLAVGLEKHALTGWLLSGITGIRNS